MPPVTKIALGCFLLGCVMLSAAGAVEPGVEDPIAKMPVALLLFGPPLAPSTPSDSGSESEPATPADQGPSLEAPSRAESPAPPTEGSEGPQNKEKTADQPAPKAETPAPAEPPKPALTPAQTALRDRVRRTLAYYHTQPLSAQESSVTEVLDACLAFGNRTEVYRAGWTGPRNNAIAHLCWNYSCAGRAPLLMSDGHIAARVGYGLQQSPAQFLAMLAQSRVSADYPIRIEKDVRTVADLVESEKLACRSAPDLSLKLIALAHYVEAPTWKNSLDEEWSVERIVKEELAQPIVGAPEGGTTRLMGLSYAIDRRAKCKQPIDGAFQRAQRYTGEFHACALSRQNSDGSWGPYFLAGKGVSRDPAVQLRASGRVLEWLALSLPDNQLDDPRVVRSVAYLTDLLSGQRSAWNLRAMSTRDIGSLMHALHALAVYDERVYKPCDVEKAPVAQAPAKK